jgi:transcriptional regulator with XRE-family HTH domain
VAGSLLARRQLGRRLRLLREAARKTQEDVEISGIASHSKLYRIEAGRTLVRPGDVRELCALYGAPEDVQEGLIALARATRAGSWQEDFADILLPGFGLFVDLEAAAVTLQAYGPELIHGLLQTPEYTRALCTADPDLGKAQIAQLLELRLARQKAALDRDPPLRITQILGQAVLTRVVGSPQITSAQLKHLRELNRCEHIQVRFLPWDAGPHPVLNMGGFTVMGFPADADPDVVYLESVTTARYLERENHLREYRRVWRILAGQSLPLEDHFR